MSSFLFMAVLEKGSKKLLNAWAFYDWANSVYPLVISSAVFPIFYGALTIIKDADGNKISDTVTFLGYDFNNDSLISYITAISFLVVSILSPILSGISDFVLQIVSWKNTHYFFKTFLMKEAYLAKQNEK